MVVLVRAELDEWKGATIIRVLASTATNHRLNHVVTLLNKEGNPRTEGRDLFLLCNKKDTEDLFGKPFARLIDARKPSADPEERTQFEEIIKARNIQKRRLVRVSPEVEEARKKPKLSDRRKGKGEGKEGRR